MGLFGPSKKEKALQAEVERLNQMLLPEQRDVTKLNQQMLSLKETIEALDQTINSKNSKIVQLNGQVRDLDQEILEKRNQLAVFEVDIEWNKTTSKTIENEYKKGNIKIIKTDAETNKGIEGVTFELQKNDGTVVATATTNAQGIANFNNIRIGEYKLKETKTEVNKYFLSFLQ